MERSENYSFSTLFKYVYYLNARIQADGQEVSSIEELGTLLHAKRVAAGHSLHSMAEATKLSERQVINIEKGRGYTKTNLEKYLSEITVTFNITELIYG